MDEMIATEREYVRSLRYVIEHYFPEMERLDLPQDLRGKRSIIFGNVEKLCDFHSQYFLMELEACAHAPLSVSSCFLRHVSPLRQTLRRGQSVWTLGLRADRLNGTAHKPNDLRLLGQKDLHAVLLICLSWATWDLSICSNMWVLRLNFPVSVFSMVDVHLTLESKHVFMFLFPSWGIQMTA